MKTHIILAASLLLALPLTTSTTRADGEAALPGLSVQLYSVRDALGTDFEGTLTQIAGMGFDAVEFAGMFGPYENDPEGLKAFLDGLGLKVSAAHVSFEKVNDDNIAATAAFYKALGTDTLIVPWDERAWSPDGVAWVANRLTEISAKLEPLGMRTGWHNHDKEFNDYQDGTYWSFIADNTPSEVVLQLDAGWARIAGKDPVAVIHAHPGRIQSTHIKAKIPEGVGAKPLIGQDDYDWAPVITALIETGGTEWFVLEQEDYPDGLTSLEAVKFSKEGFEQILADFR